MHLESKSEETSHEAPTVNSSMEPKALIEDGPKVQKTLSSETKALNESLEKLSSAEEKISLSLEFMKAKLGETPSPKFREFWEARRICLPFFKEELSVKARADLWQMYVDLSVEARRVKTILDEQSAFASEQIELAIGVLQKDLESFDSLAAQVSDFELEFQLPPFSEKKSGYLSFHKQLHILNAFAAKINGLRKEVIRTEMRIRTKNKLFESLSLCGDLVFPKRKDLIKELSEAFTEDVGLFVKYHFKSPSGKKPPLRQLREEVKQLQAMAKTLTLNTQSFKDTRLSLSFCWDELKSLDKEKKKFISEQRALQKQAYDTAYVKVQEFEAFCQDQTSLQPVAKKHDEILSALREIKDLRGLELKQIKDKLQGCRQPFDDKEEQLRKAHEEQQRQLEEKRVEKLKALQEELRNGLSVEGEGALSALGELKVSYEEKVKGLSLSKAEKMSLDALTRQLKDRILELKGQRLLDLSGSEKEKYAELQAVLEEKKQRRLEIKQHLESYRKELGGSGFDFEKAMLYRDLMASEKQVLEKMDSAINELEVAITKMEG